MLEETVSRNKKQINQAEQSKQKLKENVNSQEAIIKENEKKQKDLQDTIKQQELQITQLDEEKQKEMTDKRKFSNDLDERTREYNIVNQSLATLQDSNGKVVQEEKMCRDRIRQLEKVIGKSERDMKNLDQKNNGLESGREQALNEKMIATNAVSALTREIEWINKQTDKEQQNIHNLIRERDMMKKNLGKVEETNTKNKEELNRKQTYISTLQEKLNLKSITCTELMGLISQVEKERDTYSQDANKANANLM